MNIGMWLGLCAQLFCLCFGLTAVHVTGGYVYTLGVYVHFATSTREFLKLKLSTWILLITSIQTVVLMMNNQQIPSP